jgi:hypothetical protein
LAFKFASKFKSVIGRGLKDGDKDPKVKGLKDVFNVDVIFPEIPAEIFV